MDDIIIFGSTEDEYIDNLRAVFERLKQHGLTVHPKKCRFGLTSVEYVGHLIDSTGTHFSVDKLTKVIEVPQPRFARELKSFLGLANFFHDHVRNHSVLVAPLNEMLRDYDRRRVLEWTEPQLAAFEAIKLAIQKCPKLFFPDPHLPIHL